MIRVCIFNQNSTISGYIFIVNSFVYDSVIFLLTGQCVAAAEAKRCQLNELSLEDMRAVSELFDADVMSVWNYENSVEQYCSVGGTARSAVLSQVEAMRQFVTSRRD